MSKNKRSCSCVLVSLVFLIILCLCIAASGFYFRNDLISFYNINILPIVQNISPNLNSNSGQTNDDLNLLATDNLELRSDQEGVVTTSNGASVQIPAGSVPTMENGEIGTMNFNIAEITWSSPRLPEEFFPIGSVYELGPEGFTFNSPITISLPIPDDIDIDSVLGLTFFDTVSETWKLIPGTVNSEERLVSVMSSHFSMWSIFGSTSGSSWRDQNGGWIEVKNTHTYETGSFPGPDGTGKPFSMTYGVCIDAYNLEDPSLDNSWYKPNEWQMTVSDYRNSYYSSSSQTNEHKWWVPSGSYRLFEVFHLSEVNNFFGYLPASGSYYREIGNYAVEAGRTVDFTNGNIDFNSPEFISGRPPCYGRQDTSVGTGDVQITLTWQVNVDLDLYVIEPSGTEIYYGNTVSETSGQLDRDNMCSELVIGRPENIFWPQGLAPSGIYLVKVDYFGACESDIAVNYTVRVVIEGRTETFTGTISEGIQDVTLFEIP